jgi:hypothetical protein
VSGGARTYWEIVAKHATDALWPVFEVADGVRGIMLPILGDQNSVTPGNWLGREVEIGNGHVTSPLPSVCRAHNPW